MDPPGPRPVQAGRVVAFVALAYLLSWSFWLPLALTGTIVASGRGWPTHLPGLLGPAIAAVLVTGVTEGRAGLAELWSRMVRWRVPWAWYALVAATGALVLIPLATQQDASGADLLRYSGAPAAGLWVVLYVLVVNGFGEETGWRGYLAEHLLERHSRAVTSLIVWVVWAGWHLPMFWVVGNFRDFGAGGTIGWLVGIGFGSVFLTWLYQEAHHSILVVALWHTAYNFTTATEATATIAVASSALVIVVGLALLSLPRSWRRPVPDTASS